MDLLQSEQPAVPVEAEPRYVPQTASLPIKKTEYGHAWLRTIAAILAAIIMIALVVLLARWVYHKTHHTAQPAPATSQQSPAKSSQNTPSGEKPESGNSNGPSTPQTSPSTSSTNTQITNTGPGNVAAIFVSTSLAAAGLHYVISIRRTAR